MAEAKVSVSVVDVLSRLSGKPKTEVEADMRKSRAMLDARNACPGPHALEDMDVTKKIGKRWRCTACGGEFNSQERAAYLQGFAHGRAAR